MRASSRKDMLYPNLINSFIGATKEMAVAIDEWTVEPNREAIELMERANRIVNSLLTQDLTTTESSYAKAVSLYEKALRSMPSEDVTLQVRCTLNCAIAYYQVGDMLQCAAKCDQLLLIEPSNTMAQDLKAKCDLKVQTRLYLQRKDELGLRRCVKQLDQCMERALAGDALANILCKRGDFHQAFELAAAASADFEQCRACTNAAYCALSAAYAARKVGKDATQYFVLAANRFDRLKEYDSAAKAAYEARDWESCARFASHGGHDELLGRALLQLGRHADAIKPLERCEPTPDNSQHLATAYRAIGKSRDAQLILAKAAQDAASDQRSVAMLVSRRAYFTEDDDPRRAAHLWSTVAAIYAEDLHDDESARQARDRADELLRIVSDDPPAASISQTERPAL